MMDSSLEVQSVYGEGSTFSFEVKQKIVDETPIGDYEAKVKESIEKRDEDKYLYAPEVRLLAVDDNDMNLKVITNLLKLNGIVPDKASSGAEAIEKLKSGKYDIVLLDHMMPQMDGIETLQKAKEEELIPTGCSVIALTANAVVGAREMYLEAGFDDYLSKPVEVAALEKTLKKYLPEDKWTLRSRSEKKTETKEEPAKEARETKETKDITEDKQQLVGGINMQEGLKYCAGDEDFYHDILADYRDSFPERSQEMISALEASDMDTYAVKVHALKSVSRTIGATKLADAAFELEKAAKAGETDTVREKHPAMFEEYKRIISVIEGMDLPSKTGETDGDDDDDDIMEFLPK
jgi:CheY-like chemotaxis protein/HPt (histidine-containing phosphotransfer) domain-containing protein